MIYFCFIQGLLCGASQFALDDLEEACWDFVDHCIRNETASNILPYVKKYIHFKVGQRLLEKVKTQYNDSHFNYFTH